METGCNPVAPCGQWAFDSLTLNHFIGDSSNREDFPLLTEKM
jgi:hypothetical protein